MDNTCPKNVNKTIDEYVDKGDYKRDFAKWLEDNFKYFNDKKDAAALEEIKQNADKIYRGVVYIRAITESKSAPILQRYYQTDFNAIRAEFNAGNMEKFARSVDSLKTGIEWE